MGERVPPIPSPTRDAVVAENWAAGRATPIAQAITFALGIDLSAASPKVPIEVAATARPANFDDKLTQREREVLTLLCERYTDPEIAARLFISPRTAEGHVAHIIAKLGVENRRDAAAVAARMGYV
jgi:DNA-binding NarL/FixJ family response regulator